MVKSIHNTLHVCLANSIIQTLNQNMIAAAAFWEDEVPLFLLTADNSSVRAVNGPGAALPSHQSSAVFALSTSC